MLGSDQTTTSTEAARMMVASSNGPGKVESLAKLAGDLETFVRRSAGDGASLDHLERGVLSRILNIGFAAVEMFLQMQGTGDFGDKLVIGEGTSKETTLVRSDEPLERPLRSIFGEHRFRSYVYSRGGTSAKGKIELRPIDARLNLPEGKCSYLLQEFSQMFCVEKAFGVGARQFEAVFGQRLSVDTLESINREMGEQAGRYLEQMPRPKPSEEGAILVATADCKGVPLVKADAANVPAFDEKERPGNRRMAALGCVYTVDAHVRTAEQIVAALFRDTSVSQPSDRPEAKFKRYRACFAEPARDDGTEVRSEAVPSAYATWAWMADEVALRHREGQPVVCVMDGQPTLWDAAEVCLSEFVEQAQKRDPKQRVVDVLDIVHVSGYLWKAAKAFYSHREHREAFVQDRLLRILRGEVASVITGMRRMATQQGLGGNALKAVTTACNYFENNTPRMCYDEYLRAGYPIASGVIEGACRHVIKDRMEQGGMRWTLAGAEAMLNVRTIAASDEWVRFGSWRQSEQANRLHPHRHSVENPTQIAA
jgi:hypothetical protein